MQGASTNVKIEALDMWNLMIITIVMLNLVVMQVGSEEVVDIQNSIDDNDWCLYCKEEELEGVLFSNLKFLHREALCRLCEMGYQASVAKSPVK